MMRKSTNIISLCIIFLMLGYFSNSAAADEKGFRVIDGDTFSWNGVVYRLWGIDAPELKQSCRRDQATYPCGQMAKTYLKILIDPLSLECQEKTRSKNETRTVASCLTKGKDVSGAMVSAGWAIDYAYFSKGFYRKNENMPKLKNLEYGPGNFRSQETGEKHIQNSLFL